MDQYREAEEDRSPYCLGWQLYNRVKCNGYIYEYRYYTSDSWTYTLASDVWGVSMTGNYDTYEGGGYIVKFV